MKYHNASSNPQHLTGGRVVPPGEAVDLKEADQHLKDLLDAGLMIEVPEEQPAPPPPDPKTSRGGSA